MIVNRIQLVCDAPGQTRCGCFFPPEGPVDGTLYSVADLRAAARDKDWFWCGRPRRDMPLLR
jgi:hypothetical protein